METFTDDCMWCGNGVSIELEGEELGDGSEHLITCDHCNGTTKFELVYSPSLHQLSGSIDG